MQLTSKRRNMIMMTLLLMSACLSIYFVYYAYMINKQFGFPLDDPWIHLTFARNFLKYGSFSYFKNEIVTAGSTSPLYTFLLVPGFLLIHNEMILSYTLGIAFLLLSVWFFYKLCLIVFSDDYGLVIFATLLLVCDPWMNFIAVSGMETTMYCSLLLACCYFYRTQRALLLGFTLGLLLWTRPDSVAFYAAIITDYLVQRFFIKKSPAANQGYRYFNVSQLLIIATLFTIIVTAYFAMNLKLSGSLLPNTYAEKLALYSPKYRSRNEFLFTDVWNYFSRACYFLLIWPFMIAIIKIAYDILDFKYNRLLLPLLFIFALIFIYYTRLPYSHLFGRYLMPIIPFYIMVFAYGFKQIFLMAHMSHHDFIKSAKYTFLGVILICFVPSYYGTLQLYVERTQFTSATQVATAHWLNEHTPKDAVIATHDIGAIGFYSNRKVFDVAGLIEPQFILDPKASQFSPVILNEMIKQKVTYTAFLRDWYRVVNTPVLFKTDENRFEVMEVKKFDNRYFHILSRPVMQKLYQAIQLINTNQIEEAHELLKQLVIQDPLVSVSYYYLALTDISLHDHAAALYNLQMALKLFPENHDAAKALEALQQSCELAKFERELGSVPPLSRTYPLGHKSNSNKSNLRPSFFPISDAGSI